jgi:hypothetical protein
MGSYSTAYMKNSANIYWMDANPGFFWTTQVGGYRYGRPSETRRPTAYKTDAL